VRLYASTSSNSSRILPDRSLPFPFQCHVVCDLALIHGGGDLGWAIGFGLLALLPGSDPAIGVSMKGVAVGGLVASCSGVGCRPVMRFILCQSNKAIAVCGLFYGQSFLHTRRIRVYFLLRYAYTIMHPIHR
jgi:hypothetical protein